MIFLSKIEIEEGNSGDRMGQTGCFFGMEFPGGDKARVFLTTQIWRCIYQIWLFWVIFTGHFSLYSNIELPSWEIWGGHENLDVQRIERDGVYTQSFGACWEHHRRCQSMQRWVCLPTWIFQESCMI